MSFYTPNPYSFQRRDDERCPLSQSVDPPRLDFRTMDVLGMNDQTWTAPSAALAFGRPEGAPWMATRSDVQASAFLLHQPLPPRLPSEPLAPHSNYPPYPDFLGVSQEDLSVNGDQYLYGNFFPPAYPPTAPIYPIDTTWTEPVDVDGPLNLSPTSFYDPLPLCDISLDSDVQHGDRTQLSTPSSSRSSTLQTFIGSDTRGSGVTIEVSHLPANPQIPVGIITVSYEQYIYFAGFHPLTVRSGARCCPSGRTNGGSPAGPSLAVHCLPSTSAHLAILSYQRSRARLES